MKVDASNFGLGWMGMAGEIEAGEMELPTRTVTRIEKLSDKLYEQFKAENDANPNWPYELEPGVEMEVDLTEEEADLIKEISGLDPRWDPSQVRTKYHVTMDAYGAKIDMEIYAVDPSAATDSVVSQVAHYLSIYGTIEKLG